jgi:hypothetical protein
MATGAGLEQGGDAHRGNSVPEAGTPTREELIHLRDGLGGSWSDAAVAPPAPNGTRHPEELLQSPVLLTARSVNKSSEPVAPERPCAECGVRPARGRRPTCGEPDCVAGHRRRTKREAARGRPRRRQRTPVTSVRLQEPPKPVAVDDDSGYLPAPPPGGPEIRHRLADLGLDQLVSLSSLLPAGWRLEATASAVTVTWSR